MKKKIAFLISSFVLSSAAVFAFAMPETSLNSCRTQCRVGYDKCVRAAKNPGGLNQCKRAYDSCLGGC